jgi:hypothetical protein
MKRIIEIGHYWVQIFREPLLPAGSINANINIHNFFSILISIIKLVKINENNKGRKNKLL